MRDLASLFVRFLGQLKTGRVWRRAGRTRNRLGRRPSTPRLALLEALESRVLLTTTISSNIIQPGLDYTLSDSEEIIINENILIDTSSSTGTAGKISLNAPKITLNTGAQLRATGATGDGEISLTAITRAYSGISAVNQLEDLILLANRFSQTEISLDSGVQIVGGAITLSTDSGHITDPNSKYDQVLSLLLKPMSQVALELAHKPDLGSLPIAFELLRPSAKIAIDTSTLTSSGSVTITSTANASASGKAVYNRVIGTTNYDGSGRFGGAAGYFETDAVATIHVTGSSISSAEELQVTTTVDNAIELEVLAVKNNGITKTNPKAIDVAVGASDLHTTSTILIDSTSSLVAGGSVEIAAEAIDENAVVVTANAYRDGTVGFAASTIVSNATVQVLVEGAVSSGVPESTPSDLPKVEFSPSVAVDFATNSLVFSSPVPFETGDPLYFTSPGGATIPGLVPESVYFAITTTANPTQLQLAATRDGAKAGTAISFGNPFPTLTIGSQLLPITMVDTGTSNSVLFGFANGTDGAPTLQNGQSVTYTPVTGRFLGYNDSSGNLVGALPAGTYTVQIVDSPSPDQFPLAIQLLTTATTPLQNLAAGSVVPLNDNSYLETTSGTLIPIYSFNTESSQLDLNPPTIDATTGETITTPADVVSLQNAETLVFHSGLNNPTTNVVDGTTYYAIVDTSNPGMIRLAQTEAQAIAQNPAVQNAIPHLVTVANQAFLTSTTPSGFGTDQNLTQSQNSNGSYSLWSNATQGTFTISVKTPQGTATTSSLAYNATAAQLQTALNGLTGLVTTVTGSGNEFNPWTIAGQYVLAIGNFENGTDLVFNFDPGFAAGTELTYEAVDGKPVAGLTDGTTYYAFPADNASFNPKLPQYLLTLSNSSSSATPAIEVSLSQSFTDASGNVYTVTGVAADNGQLLVELPNNASVTAVDSTALTGGTASLGTVSPGAIQYFSFATAGSFTFSVTLAGGTGTAVSTWALDWNASAADVEDALNAIPGVQVTVTGTGVVSAPWTISGLSLDEISADSADLLYDGQATNLMSRELAYSASQVSTTATGGTFTLTLTTGTQAQTTPALAWNATADEVAAAINNNLTGIRASVTGTGQPDDPWQITAGDQSITTGMALTFTDSWNLTNLGVTDGQTCYAVVMPNQYVPQTLIVGFAATLADATASPPVLLNMQPYYPFTAATSGIMTGAPATLSELPPAGEDPGISITASLTSSDSVKSSANIGLFPLLAYILHSSSNWLGDRSHHSDFFSHIFHNDGATGIEDALKKKIPADKNVPNSFELTAAPAVADVKNTVQALVLGTANLQTAGKVTVAAELTEVVHSTSVTSIAKPTLGEGDKAVAIGFNMALVNNTSQAVIAPGANVTGTSGVSVTSDISYPFVLRETNLSGYRQGTLPATTTNVTETVEHIISNAVFSSMGGISKWLFNHLANAAFASEETRDEDPLHDVDKNRALGWCIGFSLSVIDINNNNLAQISDGAQINQIASLVGTDQPVTVKASTQMVQTATAGQVFPGLSLLWLHYASKSKNINDLFDLSGGENAIGGSLLMLDLANNTQALVGGDCLATPPTGVTFTAPDVAATALAFGNGGLTVEALNLVTNVLVVQAGGKSSGFGFEGSFGMLDMGNAGDSTNQRRQTARAQLLTTNRPLDLQANAGTTGTVEVSAADTSDLWVVSGAVLWGAPKAIGLSGSVIEIDRDVAAGMGTAALGDTATETSTFNLAGDLKITASTGGTIATASLVGAYAGRPGPAHDPDAGQDLGAGAANAASDPHGKWGLNVSGDFSGVFLADSTTAWLADEGTLDSAHQGTLDVESTNNTLVHAVSGSASIVNSKQSEDLTAGISGSAAVISDTSVVESQIASVTLAGVTAEVLATNKKLAGSFAGGMQVAVVSAADLELAGSVAVNKVTNTTTAELQDVTGSRLNDLTVEAISSDEVWAAAGLVSVTIDRRDLTQDPEKPKPKTIIGVGAAGAVNELTNSTTAQVVDSSLEFGAGTATVEAADYTRSLVLSAGVDVAVAAGSEVNVGGMFATTAFRPNTQALITGSSLTNQQAPTGDNLEVEAILIPALVSTAGYVAATWGKEFTTKETEVGVGVGAGVVVTNLDSKGTALAQTVARVTDSNLDWSAGEVTVEAYSGQMTQEYENSNTSTTTGADSLYLLAVVGSAQAEGGKVTSVGVDIAGAVIVTTLALDTLAVIDSASQVTTLGALDVLATEAFTTKSDAGGAVLAEQGGSTSATAVGVAIGGGWNQWSASNQIEASVNDSDITANSLEVAALLASTQTQVAFGVAVDAALGVGLGVSVSLSGAWAYHNIDNTIAATVAGGTLDLKNGLQVTADDQTALTVKGGAGTLGFGTDVAIAPSSAVGSVTVTNAITAVVGQTGPNKSDTALTVGGPVTIAATDAAEITSTLVAVSASASIGVAVSGSGTSASISTANTVQALLGEGVSFAAAAGESATLSIAAVEKAELDARVGAGALSVAAFGGSLGISLASITTADTVTAAITGATVATSGGDISVSTQATRQSNTISVPTSASISFGAAGAGGNSNITDSSTFAASVSGNSSISTVAAGLPAGDLTVQTLGKQSLTAAIDGGAGGLGSIGIFLSTVDRSGSVTATLDELSELNVGNLVVSATAAHTISSTGTSVTIGGLAGSGETHTAEYTETISVTLDNGPTTGAQMTGSATALAQSTTTVHAESTGATAGLLGVGAYIAVATYTPTITTTLDQFPLTAAGTINVVAQADGSNTAQAIAGSGGLISAEASVATLTTSPTATIAATASPLQGTNVSLQAVNQLEYNAYADSVNASVAGYSGATVNNTAAPSASLQINTGTTLQATTGQVGLGVSNTLVNLGGQPSLVEVGGDDESAMVRLGAGGGLVGYSGAIFSNYTPTVELSVADNVTVSGVQGILVTASQGLTTNELAILKTGGLIDVSVTNANLTAAFDTTLSVGSDTNWQSSQGGVQMGTVVDATTANIGVAKTWGLAGGAVGNATSDISVTQDVTIGSGSTLTALDDISIVAGQNPAGRNVTGIDALTLGLAHFGGLAGDSGANASLTMTSDSTLSLASGAVITSGGDVTVGATPGVNSTTQSSMHGYDRNFSKSSTSAGTVTESALATIDGQIEAGAYANLDLAFDTTGTQLTVNGVTTALNNGTPGANGVITQTIAPPSTPGADLFVPFQVEYIPQYTPSLAGFDQATAALLQTSVSSSPVVATQLTGLAAQGGQVVVVADQLAGSGTLSANTPRIQITNPSADYLLLNGVAIPGGQTAGQVTLKGATGAAPANPGFTLHPTVGESAIVVSQTYPAPVGSGTSSGPAIYITSYLNNPSGEVSLSNSLGAVIEQAPINAASVSIETPNSAFILSTPQAPFGVGGNITDAWGATRQGLNPQTGASIPALTGAFLPGQTTTGWDANLAATTVVDYLFNGTSSTLANGAQTLANSTMSADTFAEYYLYKDSGVKSSNSPNSNPNGSSWIYFGNSIPFYNTGWSNGNGFGSTSDNQSDAGQASWTGSGSGFFANSDYYQFAYNGVSANAGALPYVVPNLPLSVTQPESVVQKQLSSGLTAAQVSITAALIDINAPLNVGVSRNLNVVLSASLGATLSVYRAAWQAGTQTNPTYTIPETALGVGIEGVTATYNAQTNEITLGSIATSSATVSALLTGGMVSTVSTGKINMIGGPGITSITNATGIPLVLSGIDSGATQVTGIVEINDTIQQTSTKYVYIPGAGVDVYTAALNQSYAATPNSSGGNSVQSYQPLAGLQINQQQNVVLVRELNFSTPGGTNGNGSTNIDTGNTAIRPAPVGFWNFDNTYGTVTGFGQFHNAGGATITDTELTLTDGVNNTAAATWLTSSLNTTVGFKVNFTYQASGSKAADGVALVFQNEGFGEIGGTGGSLGYVGITGNTAAYQMNIYNGHTVGTNFVTSNTSGTYNATGSVNIASGDPIEVELVYDPLTQTLSETLTDTITNATYTTTHTGVNLATSLGESCFIGFTGGDGGATSIQTVSDFTLKSDQTTPWSSPSSTLTMNGVGNYSPVGSPTITSSTNSIELTNGNEDVATAVWNKIPLDVTQAFAIGFVYQAGGNAAGDGIAVVFQNEGLTALGGEGGYLGYVGITGHTAAYEMNLFSGNGVGTNFVTTNTSGTYNSTGNINIASGHKIQVTLVYNPVQQVLVETLTDLTLTTNTELTLGVGHTYTKTYTGINLAQVLGANQCYVGFTGGSGSDTAVQTVSNPVIALSSSQTAPVNSLLARSVNSVSLPTGTSLAQFVTVGPSEGQISVQNKFGNNGSGPPWGVGNDHTWNYYYPTSYQMFQSSAVKADNPFSISFEAMQQGGVSVVSTANLVIDGLIRMAGDVSLSSLGTITQTLQGSIEAQNLDLIADSTSVQHGFGLTTAIQTSPTTNSVILTDGVNSTAAAVWVDMPLNTSLGFTAQFTYQAGGNKAADGIALVFQNQGLSALGNVGGSLGYVGITGTTAAYQMNLYDGHVIGTNFVTTNTSGTYNTTGSVNIASGDPIDVTLVYDPTTQTVTETLTDSATGATFQTTHTSINLNSLLGATCLIGFTGADGGATSTQTVSNFSLATTVPASVGTADTPLQINLTSGSSLDAFAPGGIFVTSPTDLVVDSVAAIPLTIGGFTTGPSEWSLVNGDVGITNFSDFTMVGDAVVVGTNSAGLRLTNDTGDSASAAWYPNPVSTSSFTINFQYQATGNQAADGIAVVFQNSGTSALGGEGSDLGYVGIPEQTVAYEMNLYSLWGVGTNFVTTNSSTQYNSTGGVNIASGNLITVQLAYDGLTQTMTETLTESLSTGGTASYQHVYTDIRLAALLGPTATFGFTGGDGSDTSIQTISVVAGMPLFQQTVPEIIGDSLLAIPGTGIGNQLSAAWHRTPIDITRDFQASFVYQSKGTNPADGLALVFQNEGLNAIGGDGGELGYAGITGNTAAYEINIYNGHTIGSNVVVNGAWGTYNATGSVDFASGNRISVQLAYNASASTITESLIDLETGATWQRVYSSFNLLSTLFPGATANATNPQTAIIGFTAANGAAFAEQIVSEFQFAYDVASTGDIVLTSTQGAVVMAGPGSLVRGGTITVNATTSGGSAATPLNLQLDSQTLANGSVVGGVLNATVGTDLYVQQLAGNLRLGAVAATGTVAISVTDGSITDGLAVDSSALNQIRSAKHRQQIQQQLWKAATDPARQTIAAYEAQIDRNYLQYWNLIPYGTVSGGTFTLNSSAIPQFAPQAALYYGVDSATDAQVQSWANLTYGNCVTTFANTLAFGPLWASLPQFATYDASYSFVAPPTTVAALSSGSESVFSVISTASLLALDSAAVSGNGPGVNVLGAQQLTLSASKTIGLLQDPVVIPLSDISQQTLTPEQALLLELASAAGSLQMVGTSTTGETITYDFNHAPAGVTPTGIQVSVSRPVFVNLAVGGTVSATAPGVSLTQTVGNLTVDSITATGPVRLEAQGNLLSSSATLPAVAGSRLNLITGGTLGSAASPFLIAATGVVHANALGDLYLSQSAGDLQMGEIIAGGTASLQATGSLVDGQSNNRENLTGFGTNGTGWTTSVDGTPNAPQIAVVNNVATFTNPANPGSGTSGGTYSVLYQNDTVNLATDWIIGFVYETTGNNGGLSLTLYNGSTGAPLPTAGWTEFSSNASFLMNLAGDAWGDLPAHGNTVGFLSPVTFNMETPGSVNLSSGHPIKVILSYSASGQTLSAQLTDLTTNEQFTIASDFNLMQALGTPQVRLSLQTNGTGANNLVQTVSNFWVLDGAANISAESLTATAGAAQEGFLNATGVSTTPTANSVTLTDGVNSTSSAVWLNTPLNTTQGFTAQFTYQASGNKAADGIALAFQNEGTSALGGVGGSLGYVGITGNTAAYQMNIYNGHAIGTNFVTTNTSGNYNITTGVNIASGDPIDVTLVYDAINQTVTETLTDTTTKGTYSHTYTGINLSTLLGNSCYIGFTGGDGGATSIQTVSNFTLSNTVFGTPDTAVNLLITGEISIEAPGGVNALQMAGDLTIGTITAASTATVTLAAPLGSIVGSVSSGNVSSPGMMAVQSAAPGSAIDLTAGTAHLSALGQIGTVSTPLATRVTELSATAHLGRLNLGNRGALTIIPGPEGRGVSAGKNVQLLTSDALKIDAGVQAVGNIGLQVTDLGLAHQFLTATANAQIRSQTGSVELFAPDAVQLQPGSLVSATGTGVGPQVTVGLTRTTSGPSDALLQSQGQIVADRVALVGGQRGTQFEVAHSGLTGQMKAPAVSIAGTNGTDRLVINHRDAKAGQSFTISDAALANALASYAHTSIESVLLDLGNFADTVTIQGLQQLRNVEVRGNGGDDQFRMNFLAGSSAQVLLAGGLGSNRLTYDGAGLPLWAKAGVVQSLTSQVQHSQMQTLVPQNTPSLNGTPVLMGVNVEALLAGLAPTQRYVQATFLQLVQRLATPAELSKWTTSINKNPNDPTLKLALVNFLFDSDEGRTVQLKAWFQTFVGRAGTPAELTSWLNQYRAIKDPLLMQQRFLMSDLVYQYTQTLSTTGTADERYVEGLWRLMVDPGYRMTAAEKQSWIALRNRLGRTGFLANLQKQTAYLQSQQEAFTELLANGNSQFTNLLAGAPKFTSHIEMWKWLLARRKV